MGIRYWVFGAGQKKPFTFSYTYTAFLRIRFLVNVNVYG